jgi:hypothetical protein
MRAKHIIGDFERVFEGAKTFLDPRIAKGNFGAKKSIMCFASIQKIASQTIRISCTLIFLFTGAIICPIFFVLSLFIVF